MARGTRRHREPRPSCTSKATAARRRCCPAPISPARSAGSPACSRSGCRRPASTCATPSPAVRPQVAPSRRSRNNSPAVPDHGIGYGMLRYLNAETRAVLAALPSPQISFNYLGRVSAGDDPRRVPGGGLGAGHRHDRADRYPQQRDAGCTSPLDINAMVVDVEGGPRLSATVRLPARACSPTPTSASSPACGRARSTGSPSTRGGPAPAAGRRRTSTSSAEPEPDRHARERLSRARRRLAAGPAAGGLAVPRVAGRYRHRRLHHAARHRPGRSRRRRPAAPRRGGARRDRHPNLRTAFVAGDDGTGCRSSSTGRRAVARRRPLGRVPRPTVRARTRGADARGPDRPVRPRPHRRSLRFTAGRDGRRTAPARRHQPPHPARRLVDAAAHAGSADPLRARTATRRPCRSRVRTATSSSGWPRRTRRRPWPRGEGPRRRRRADPARTRARGAAPALTPGERRRSICRDDLLADADRALAANSASP